MGRVVRYQFMGSLPVLILLSVFVITIPWAVVYLLQNTLRLEHETDDPEAMVASLSR
ncbi:MAG: hypothetical protein H6811_05455 [Phycisphaeraceae bacterium]|nr:hypothetical protein [Phycisphaeraceae bacterium]